MSIGKIEAVGNKKEYVRYATKGGSGVSGVPVGNVQNLTLENRMNGIHIGWTDPDDIIFNGEPVAKWAGTKVVRKENTPPVSVDDGVVVSDSKERNKYELNMLIDTGLSKDVEYNYALFPYTDKNVYTLSDMNRAIGSLANYSTELSENTWQAIDAASREGVAKEYWKVGDTKDGYVIVGFDHDDLADGTGKAGITFACNEQSVTVDSKWTNTSYTTNSVNYLWTSSTAYSRLNGFETETFDKYEVAKYVKPVLKKVRNSTTISNTSTKTVTSRIFLFSYVEAVGTKASENFRNEGKVYSDFPLAFSSDWWTRTPALVYQSGLGWHSYYISSTGGNGNVKGTLVKSLRYGFCI